MAAALGMDEVEISLDWNQIETGTGFDFTIIDIIDIYYPSKQMPVTRIFWPINTKQLTLPTDIDPATVDQWVIDYGMSASPCVNAFKEFLGTLGLRKPDTTNKTAWTTLSQEAGLRGW